MKITLIRKKVMDPYDGHLCKGCFFEKTNEHCHEDNPLVHLCLQKRRNYIWVVKKKKLKK